MEKDELNIEETTLAVDLSEATDAVKNGSFEHALSLLKIILKEHPDHIDSCLLYTSPSPRDLSTSRMPSSA